MTVKRYDFGTEYRGNTGVPGIVGKSDGRYVRHGDYAKVVAHNEYLLARLQKSDDQLATIKADRQQRGEPVAFSYELATTRSGDGEYTHWSPRLSYSMPNVPDGSIRNLKWLYATPHPAVPSLAPSDEENQS